MLLHLLVIVLERVLFRHQGCYLSLGEEHLNVLHIYIYVLLEKLQLFSSPRNIPWNLSGFSQTPASPPWSWWNEWHLFLVWLKRATEADNKPSDMFGLIIFLPSHVRVPPPAACSVPQAEPCRRIFSLKSYLLVVIGDLSDHAAIIRYAESKTSLIENLKYLFPQNLREILQMERYWAS